MSKYPASMNQFKDRAIDMALKASKFPIIDIVKDDAPENHTFIQYSIKMLYNDSVIYVYSLIDTREESNYDVIVKEIEEYISSLDQSLKSKEIE